MNNNLKKKERKKKNADAYQIQLFHLLADTKMAQDQGKSLIQPK